MAVLRKQNAVQKIFRNTLAIRSFAEIFIVCNSLNAWEHCLHAQKTLDNWVVFYCRSAELLLYMHSIILAQMVKGICLLFTLLSFCNHLVFCLFGQTKCTMFSRLWWLLFLADHYIFLAQNTNEEKRNAVKKQKSKPFLSNAVEKYPSSSDQGDCILTDTFEL